MPPPLCNNGTSSNGNQSKLYSHPGSLVTSTNDTNTLPSCSTVNINTLIANNHNTPAITGNGNHSSIAAALSTAAAVAAISRFSNPNNNTSSNTNGATATNSMVNMNLLNTQSHLNDTINEAVAVNTPSSLVLSVPFIHNASSLSNAKVLKQNQQNVRRGSISSNTSLSISTNTSNSNTPCPTPGPLAPPPSRLLPQHQHSNTTSSMLPQNQLVYNHHQNTSANQGNLHQGNSNTSKITNHNHNNNSNNIDSSSSSSHNNDHNHGNQNVRTTIKLHPSLQQSQQQHPPPSLHPGMSINTLSAPTTTTTTTTTFHPSFHGMGGSTGTTINSFRPRQMQLSTPNIFANTALRRGKWTAEEERFANALITEFEKGTILDCENGCTLRAYLSRKLHCAPMRISKKYAGKSIGKHVFLSRISSLSNRNVGGIMGHMNVNGISQTTQSDLDKIRDLEFRFHMSLLQEGAACALGQNIGKTLSSRGGSGNIAARVGNVMNQGLTHVNNGAVSGAGGSFPMIYPSPHSSYSSSNTTTTSNAAATTPSTTFLNVPSHTITTRAPSTTFQWFTPGAASTLTAAPGTTANANTNTNAMNSVNNISNFPTTIQMRETLLHAFKEAQTSSSSSHVNSSTSNTPQSQQQSTRNNMIQPQFNSTQSSKNTMIHQTEVKGTLNNAQGVNTTARTTTGSSSDTTGISELFSHFPSEYTLQSNNEKNNDPNNHISTSQAQQNWLSETMHIIPTLDPSSYMGQFSPTYTSKSFDDLHQFIGSDCPPSANPMKTKKNPELGEMRGPATDAANTMHLSITSKNNCFVEDHVADASVADASVADAYALFAQQSATAVSKHSAYANPNEGCGNSSSPLPVANTMLTNHEIPILPTPQQQNNFSSTIGKNLRVREPNTLHNRIIKSAPVVQSSPKRSLTTDRRVNVIGESSSSATFNAANLQLHSAAVEEMERADKAANDGTNSESNSDLSRDLVQPTTTSNSEFSSSSVLMHTNIVSGSDQSSSDNGNESVSAGGSGLSGSENSSDNSDSASDEGQASSNKSTKNCKRRNEKHNKEHGAKRQKTCVKNETN